jgi:hypothetical protein
MAVIMKSLFVGALTASGISLAVAGGVGRVGGVGPNFAGCAGDEKAFHGDGAPGTSGYLPLPPLADPWKSASPGGPRFLGPAKDPETADRLRPLTMAAAVSSDHRGARAMRRRSAVGGARLFQPAGQALSTPDAFATWVAIASISAGERQSYGSSLSSFSRERIAGIWSGGVPDSMMEETNAANSGADQPRSFESSVWTKSKP